MNAAMSVPEAQAQSLLAEIRQQTQAECGRLSEAASRKAEATIADAKQAARRHLKDAIAQLRRDGARRLTQAVAQRETERRQQEQALAGQRVARSWPLLADALRARWHDAAARQRWTEAAARYAVQRIRPEAWTVCHPAGWPDTEREAVRGVLGGRVAFKAVPEIAAGLRIEAEGATVDATDRGLLADQGAVAALLLAAVETGGRP